MGIESQADSTKAITLRLYALRDHEVILDRDLAAFYGIPTKRLNRYVKRHARRFPPDFAFHVTDDEWQTLRALMPARVGRGGLGYRPHVFTEQGVMMVASVMRGRRAVALSIEILRAFARSRAERTESPLDWTDGIFNDADRIAMLERELLGEDPSRVTYFIQAGSNGLIKIGVTTDFASRFRSLQMSSPEPLRVLGILPKDIENECHVFLAEWRLHGEWFTPSPEVLAFIQDRLPKAPSLN